MNRKEAKELLPVMQAYAEGKAIQYRAVDGGYWYDVEDGKDVEWDRYEFRIKPEVTYRPFEGEEECWNEMLKHQPFGWLSKKDVGSKDNGYDLVTISEVMDRHGSVLVAVGNKSMCRAEDIFDEYMFFDGTPFGIKEGGEG